MQGLLKVGKLAVLPLFLNACVSFGPTSPADIKPVYQVRNAPIPVPYPRAKPSVPGRAATGYAQAYRPEARRSSSRVIRVNKGDTLYALSRAHNIPVRDLIKANNLRAPYDLAVGQRLNLPVAHVHTVQKGETGYSISRQYGVTVSALMTENKVKYPYRLSVGQKLTLPGGAELKTAANTSSSASTPSSTARRQAVRPAVSSAAAPPRSGTGFHWPVEGKIASRYGPKQGGLHNDGINILAKQGSPVHASESGVVVYASNALEGYGNLLLVRHQGGWMTAYAHNERLLVRPGQKVGKGEVIARVGTTGSVTVPQLHFEIRKGRQALDPLKYLRETTASAR